MNQPTPAATQELRRLGLRFESGRTDYQIVMPPDVPESTKSRVLGIALRAFPRGFRVARQTWTETRESVILTVFPR